MSKHSVHAIATYALLVIAAPLVFAPGANAQVNCPAGYVCTPINQAKPQTYSNGFYYSNDAYYSTPSSNGYTPASGGNAYGDTAGGDLPVTGQTCYVFTQDLYYGSYGADVAALQKFLISRGYWISSVTSYFGSQTSAALKSYKAATGITESYFGPLTRAAINASCSSANITPVDNRFPIKNPFHSADLDHNWKIDQAELDAFQVLYSYRAGTVRTGEYSVGYAIEGGSRVYVPGPGTQTGMTHSGDSNHDWHISLLELTRVIELKNAGGYKVQAGTEDGFAPVVVTPGPIFTNDTDLYIPKVVKASFHPYGFTMTLCMAGSKSINEIEKTNTRVSGYPGDIIAYDSYGNEYKAPGGSAGAIEDLKNGQCMDIGITLQSNQYSAFDQTKKATFRVDNENLIPETNESNNSFTYVGNTSPTASVDIKVNGVDSVGVYNNDKVHVTWSSGNTTYCLASGSMFNIYGGGTWGNQGRLGTTGSVDVIAYTSGTLPWDATLGMTCYKPDGTSVFDKSIVSINASSVQVPVLTSLNPSYGGTMQIVKATGYNLAGASSVNFRNSSGQYAGSATTNNVTDSSFYFMMPFGLPAGAYQVSVVTSACKAGCDSNSLTYTVVSTQPTPTPAPSATPTTPSLSSTSWYADDPSTWPTVRATSALTSSQAMRVKGATGDQYLTQQNGVTSAKLTSTPPAGTTQIELYVYDYATGTKYSNQAVNIEVLSSGDPMPDPEPEPQSYNGGPLDAAIWSAIQEWYASHPE